MVAKYFDGQYKISMKRNKKSITKEFIVDTGAVMSCIGISSLKVLINKADMDENQVITILKGVDSKYHKVMKSASNDEMLCTRCKLKNVYIGGELIKEFHFIVPLQEKSEVMLLGLDFIKCFRTSIEYDRILSLNQFKDEKYNNEQIEFLPVYSLFDFDVVEYLKEKFGEFFSLVPQVSIKQCKTKEDCDALIKRLGGLVWGNK